MNERLVLGADVGGTSVKFVVVDADGMSIVDGSIRTDVADAGSTFALLAAEVASLLNGGTVTAVGLACAGIVDPVAGTLGRAPNLPGWEGSDLRTLLGAAFGPVACAVANDVNAALVGERHLGAGRQCRDLVMYALGTGVGGGIMIEGRLVVGARHGAAELGHVVLDRGGPPCSCGNNGCLEAYAGAVALAAEAKRLSGLPGADPDLVALCARNEVTPHVLAQLAEAGSAQVIAMFHEAGRRLGQAVGGVVNTLDPERIIIGGGVAQAGDLILGPCRVEAARIILGERSKSIPIVPAELGPRAAAVGAAVLATEEVVAR